MSARHLVACVQLRSTEDRAASLDRAEALIARAAHWGAKLVATPENTPFLGAPAAKVASAEPLDGPTGRRMAHLARTLGIHLLVGSVGERLDDRRCYNTSLLYGPDGGLLARYRKLHLFDVDLASAGGVRFAESQRTEPGDEVVVADTPLGPMGLSICFDLRYPELYAAQVRRGARLLAVPSAFTERTGRDHWHALLRARAIETQCWVLAPAQWGAHDDQGLRRSYGHSLIVDPWGTVVAACGDGEGICLAEVDPRVVDEVRARIPMEANRRL